MALKIKHIGTRFLLQGVLSLILVSTLVIILVLSSNRKKETLKAISAVEKISATIQQLNYNLSQALVLQKTDADFVSLTADKIMANQTKQIIRINDSLTLLTNLKYLKKNFAENLLADSLKNYLNLYNHSFELAILTLKTKGNRSNGLVADTYLLCNELIDLLKTAPDKGLLAAQLENTALNYFNVLDLARLNTLNDFCENLPYSFSEFPAYDVSLIFEKTTQLSSKLNSIAQFDLHLFDQDNNKGQLADVSQLFSKLNIYRTKLVNSVNLETYQYIQWWNFFFIILALILTSVYVYLMYIFRNNVSANVQKLVESTSHLISGNFELTVEKDGAYEFKIINSNLSTFKSLLNERQQFIEMLLNDNFSQKIELLGIQDKFTTKLIDLREKLRSAQEEQLRRNKENEVRRYINEGLAKFGDIMRLNSSDTQALGDNLIRELVKYLGALQGGIFIVDEHNTENLNLVAAFAYDRKKYIIKTIKIGEGLVGTCAIERKTINLDEVPKDYVIIKSGLGDTPPNNILLLPVIHEDNLIGVIELASLKMLNEHEVELAELIASNLASTIITVKNNTQTALLLEKSQQQAAEMAEQEEEMRQNMEELKATQEESTRREEELMGLFDAIGNSFFIIEYNFDGSVQHLNDSLVKFLAEPYEALIGRKHQDIFSSASLLSAKFFIDLVSNKESKSLSETLPWGSKIYTYKHNLSPVISNFGDVIKIINLLTIEEEKIQGTK